MELQASLLDRFRTGIAQDAPLTVLDVKIFQGPSPYAECSSALCWLDSSGTEISMKTLRERLRAALPAACELGSGSSKDKADAVAIAACVAELARGLLRAKADLDPLWGSCVESHGAVAWVEHSSILPGLQALKTALAAVAGALQSQEMASTSTSSDLQYLERACALRKPNLDVEVMIAAARRRSVPYLRLGQHKSVWQFGWGSRSERFWVTASNADGMVAQRISRDKELAKRFLRQLGIPTPESRVVGPDDDFRPAVGAIGWPCVVKPLTGGAGRGVSADINDMASAERAVAVARRINSDILVERHVVGDDHRLMVIDGKVVAAVRRARPAIIGDGKARIGDLIDAFNAQRRRRQETDRFLEEVALDDALAATLASQGFDHHSVPAKGTKVLLRTASNRSTGGTCEDVTDEVHPQIREMAQHCAAAFGFRATGIDYITPDISRSFQDVGGGVLELNTTPGTRVLLAAGIDPDELGAHFLGTKPGRIPVALLVAPKESLASVEKQLAEKLPLNHGLTTSAAAQIGDFLFPDSHQDAPSRTEMVLCHPAVERLLILWDTDEVQHFGLPVDRLDSVVLMDASLEERWIEVLRRHSGKFRIEKSGEKAVAAILRKKS